MNDFYLITDSERSGRCRVSQQAAGLGLTAAIMAELMLDGHLQVYDGRVFQTTAPAPPQDPMLHPLSELMAFADAAIGRRVLSGRV